MDTDKNILNEPLVINFLSYMETRNEEELVVEDASFVTEFLDQFDGGEILPVAKALDAYSIKNIEAFYDRGYLQVSMGLFVPSSLEEWIYKMIYHALVSLYRERAQHGK